MAAVCSNKLQLEIKKANDIPPAPLFIFLMSLGIRHQNLCERGLSEISTSLSLPFTLVFLLIFVLYFFFVIIMVKVKAGKQSAKGFPDAVSFALNYKSFSGRKS